MGSEWIGPDTDTIAHADMEQHIASVGRQLPTGVADRAERLLACVYRCGNRDGVSPRDWAVVASLPGDVLEVVIHTERRRE